MTLCACAVGLLAAMSGCNSAQRTAKNGDPLVGEMQEPKFGIAPGSGKGAAATKAKAGPTALPSATSSTSLAAVVQGTGDPLTGDRPPLAIAPQGPAQTAGAWQPNGSGFGQPGALTAAQGTAPVGAILKRPEPVVVPLPAAGLPASSGAIPAGTWSTGAGVSYDQLQEQLVKFNPVYQKQETWNGGFKFSCEVPNPLHPEFTHVYEGTARDYRSALLAVLEQIDRDRQRR